MRKEHKTWTWC